MRLTCVLLVVVLVGCASARQPQANAKTPPATTQATSSAPGGEIELRVLDAWIGHGRWWGEHTALHMNLEGVRDPFFAVRGTHGGPGVSQEYVAQHVRDAAVKTDDTLVVSFYVSESDGMTLETWMKSVHWLREAVKKANVKNKVIIVAYIAGAETGNFKPPMRAAGEKKK
jgi:hypothetical protein